VYDVYEIGLLSIPGNKHTDFSLSLPPSLIERLRNIDLVGSSLFGFLIKEFDVPLGFKANRNIEAKVS
jgi:hypothetical protein